MGNARRFKEELGDSVKIVAAEPMQGEPVQGLRSLDDGFIPPIIDISPARPEDLRHQPRRDRVDAQAARRGGHLRRRLERRDRSRSPSASPRSMDEGNVVFIVCDDGWKYLSSGIYTLPVDEIENLDSTVWW